MWEEELEDIKYIASIAGKAIMEFFNNGFVYNLKDDLSPVTSADKASNDIIVNYLKEKYPRYAILSEENHDDFSRLDNDYVWIIDPLDGTVSFMNHETDFVINIALSYKHEIVVSVVYIPYTKEFYFACKQQGSFLSKEGKVVKLHVNNKITNLTCLVSKNHFTEAEKNYIGLHCDRISEIKPIGSGIKPCLIAKGEAEISYRFSDGTKQWDTAAPQLILEEAGGYFLKPNGEKITYNRKDVYNREGYICVNNLNNWFK